MTKNSSNSKSSFNFNTAGRGGGSTYNFSSSSFNGRGRGGSAYGRSSTNIDRRFSNGANGSSSRFFGNIIDMNSRFDESSSRMGVDNRMKFSEFKKTLASETVFPVVVHHNRASVNIDSIDIIDKLKEVAGLTGAWRTLLFRYSLVSVSGNKNGWIQRKLILYCKTEEIAAEMVKQGKVSVLSNTLKVDRSDVVSECNKVKKVITCKGVLPEAVSGVVDKLKQYAVFTEDDVLVSTTGQVTVRVQSFTKAVPATVTISKSSCRHVVNVRASGYSEREIKKFSNEEIGNSENSDLSSGKSNDNTNVQTPEEKVKGKSNESKSSDESVGFSSFVEVKADRTVVCNYCGIMGHRRKNCKKHKEFLDNVECFNCYQKGHTSKFCDNLAVCRSCKKPGHKSWDKICPLKQKSLAFNLINRTVSEARSCDVGMSNSLAGLDGQSRSKRQRDEHDEGSNKQDKTSQEDKNLLHSDDEKDNSEESDKAGNNTQINVSNNEGLNNSEGNNIISEADRVAAGLSNLSVENSSNTIDGKNVLVSEGSNIVAGS